MKILDESGTTRFLQTLLEPILRVLSISKQATNLTVMELPWD